MEGRAGVCRSCALTESAGQAVQVCWAPGCSGLLGPGSRQEEGRSSTSPVWSGREAFHTILS